MQYLDSNFLQAVRHDFEQDRWPAGCERCQIEEENGISSKRLLDWQRWSQHYQNHDLTNNKFLTASVAFGNTCNLKCITCGSYSSSRWQQEYREIYHIDNPHVQFYRKDFVKRFTELAPGLIHLDVPGGEPFVSGVLEQQSLLQHYIDDNKASNMTLHYTTNGSIFPDQTWWNLWKHFKEIDLQISIDGVGSRYEYIRFPADWSMLVKHVNQYQAVKEPNFKLSVSHTVSAYNIFYLDEFFDWCYNVGLPRPWLGRVHKPVHMRPTVWCTPAREIIVENLHNSKHADVQQWSQLVANNNDSEYFDEFRNKLYAHDQYRKLDFTKTFPELANYI